MHSVLEGSPFWPICTSRPKHARWLCTRMSPLIRAEHVGEGRGAIVDIEELVDLIGGEFAQSVHALGVASHITSVEFIVWSVGHSQYFDACLFLCRFKHFSCR
jgi:hypothetical protein